MVTQDREGEGDTRINPEDFASSSHALKNPRMRLRWRARNMSSSRSVRRLPAILWPLEGMVHGRALPRFLWLTCVTGTRVFVALSSAELPVGCLFVGESS